MANYLLSYFGYPLHRAICCTILSAYHASVLRISLALFPCSFHQLSMAVRYHHLRNPCKVFAAYHRASSSEGCSPSRSVRPPCDG